MASGVAGKAKRARESRADGSLLATVGRRMRRRLRRWGSVTLVVTALVVGVFLWLATRPGTHVPSLGNAHIASGRPFFGAYNSDPPTSGPHLPSLAPWGVHAAPIAKELQVHNLEDGGVLVQYDCPGGCPELVKQLEEVVRRYDTRVILAPYPGMDHRIALTAWTRIDKFDVSDERRIVRFIEAYRGIDHHARSGRGR